MKEIGQLGKKRENESSRLDLLRVFLVEKEGKGVYKLRPSKPFPDSKL